MNELLKKFCISEKQNGLLLVDMPTGTGKTHGAVEFIYNNYQNCKGKIIYVTNLKKNLPMEELRKFFQKDSRESDYEKDVLFIDNNVDNLIENFKKIQGRVPERFQKGGAYENIRRSVSVIMNLKEALSKGKVNETGLGGKDSIYAIMQQSKEDLSEKYEREFRILIENELQFNDEKKKRTKKEKLDLIKNDADFAWIGELYPSVFTDEKKIIFMSIDKLLVRNTTLVEPSYQIIDSKGLFKNSWLFIDEFDISKEVMLSSIINESINTKMGILELFRGIYNGYNTNFSETLTEVSEDLQEKIVSSANKLYTSTELLEEFRSKANRINSKYNLESYHKLDLRNKDKANFLFQDYKFHTIFNDKTSNVIIENDKEKRLNWIKNLTESKEVLREEENIFNLLREVNDFLTYFQNGVRFIAQNYMSLKRQRNQETNNFSYEASVKTVLSEFGIEGKFLAFLTAQILNNQKRREYKIGDLKSELDNSVYEKGFRYYHLVDSDIFDTQSKINYLTFSMTPEKLLIYLAKVTKIIGISASGTLKTVTGNFDLDYVKSKIGDDYFEMPIEDVQAINLEIEKKLGDYKKVNIEINKCDVVEENYSLKLSEIIPDDEDRENVLKRMNDWALVDFVRARYVKLFYAMRQFFEKDINSYLFLTNVTVKQGVSFNFSFIQEVFGMLKKQYSKIGNEYCYSLEGALERFESLKKDINKHLKAGKRVFVISSYQTLGAGQNLQYEYDESSIALEEINDNPYGKGQKDFDALFLDKPTNLFVNINSAKSEDQLLKFIYQIKCLEQVGHYTLEQADELVRTGFKIFHHGSPRKLSTPKSKHVSMHSAKILLQAVGRICRTKNKSSNIVISYDSALEKDLVNVRDDLLIRPLNYEFRKLLESCGCCVEVEDSQLMNTNDSKARKCFDMIKGMRIFRTNNDIRKWEELREIVLKYPTDNHGLHNSYDIYCEFDEARTYYYYSQPSKKEYRISLKENEGVVNEGRARLETLMTIPTVKAFFEEKGYATSFEKSNHIMLPPVFNGIYLGALGEAIGEYLLNELLKSFGEKLERIKDIKYYEKFDFFFNKDIYVDFKHWTGFSDLDRDNEVKRIVGKLDECNGRIGLIINILKPMNYSPKIYETLDSRLRIIPYLYDAENKEWNMDAINQIKGLL